ncbi:hypothetical protein AOQ84DRAFT_375732 [Glonium stellatum]|uniref:MARVEL domain-containing protein n=1 Tax=Glonium stellatum TaxID=574774 RepID=A0A8E2JUE8_9PEZI|nr:hypothetical protein AOQ84DRAFT_375732 [Glonium stellatum]
MFSLFLRFGEFVCAAVVMGIVAFFLHQHHKYNIGPEGREIYTEVIAVISVVLSLVWLLPFTSQFLHYPFDLIISAAWFAAFAALVNWIHRLNCGGIFHWAGLTNGSYCGQWKAAEAFSFISACFWLASAILGWYVYHHLRDRAVATDSTTTRRRWGRSRV